MGRQFIAVVPEGPQENLELKQLMGKLRRTMSDREQEVRWIPPDLWHVTLQFLGDVGPHSSRLREVFDSMKLSAVGDLELRLQSFGAFPESEAARVLWIGVQENQAFLTLQAELAGVLSGAGFMLGDKEFKPHLTIARFRNPLNASQLLKLGGRKHFGDYPVREIILFESVLQGNIIKYMPIARRPVASLG
jgi:2'-5' RNA ligase